MQPNIVFAFADDWGRYASAYRDFEPANTPNALIDTPHFDRVAREGVLFKNAQVPAPTCTPCRSSVLSGQYFWQTGLGAILQGAVWDENIPTYPLILEQHGYHIGHTYKVWSPGRTANAPYGATRTQYQSAGTNFGHFSHYVTERGQKIGIEAAKEELYDETRQNFQSFLDAREDGKPFCYWWGPTNTHRTWEAGSGKALWDIDPDDMKGRVPAFLPDVPEVREDWADYLGECLAVDAGLGVLLEKLEEIGELENTIVVVSGDHGIPGIPRGKCNLYDLGAEVALAARWPAHIKPGRIVDDFVNLMDLAPTFLDVAGIPVAESMSGRSILPLLQAESSGQIDPERTCVVTGRERHVAKAREGNLPYPQRAIRTNGFLYIRNFEPDRWPMGDPAGLDDLETDAPSFEELRWHTMLAYKDMDASPTKAWMIHHRKEEEIRPLFELGFGKRPAEELYDLREDRYYMRNVAGESQYAEKRQELSDKLMRILLDNDDPRICEDDCRFEKLPFTNPCD